MMYGYGILNNHVPTLRAAMRGGSASPFLTSLYAVYKAESNANDSLATYNGTAQGGLTYTAGKSGNAFTFNGTNAYVQLPNGTFGLTGDFSISTWINPTAQGGYNYIFQDYYGPASLFYGVGLYIQGGYIRFAIYNTTSNVTQGSTAISNNTWYHVVITKKSNTTFKMYVNNTLQTLTVLSGAPSTNPSYTINNSINIGSDYYGVRAGYFNGKIDEVNIWNREVTATEVTELYNTGTGKFYPY